MFLLVGCYKQMQHPGTRQSQMLIKDNLHQAKSFRVVPNGAIVQRFVQAGKQAAREPCRPKKCMSQPVSASVQQTLI